MSTRAERRNRENNRADRRCRFCGSGIGAHSDTCRRHARRAALETIKAENLPAERERARQRSIERALGRFGLTPGEVVRIRERNNRPSFSTVGSYWKQWTAVRISLFDEVLK